MTATAPPHASSAGERRATLAALAAVALWSTVATAFKLGLSVLAPLQLLLAATLVSTAVFIAAAAVAGQWRFDRRELIEAVPLGLANPLIYYLVLFEAYDRLPAQIAQPLNYTWAIALALLAVPVLGQPLTGRSIAGILLSYSGVVVLLSGAAPADLPRLDWVGVALALASTLVWAGYWLAHARTRAAPARLMALSFAAALPIIAVLCALGPGLPPATWQTALYGGWVGVVEMGVTFLLWQKALRLTSSAARIGQLIFLSPFLSLALIATVLGEAIQATSVAGLAVIIAGLIVTGRPHTSGEPAGGDRPSRPPNLEAG